MEKYSRVEKPKAETPINENEIRVTTQGLIRNYITYAISLLQEKDAKEIVLKAMGQAISKTVAIAEILKKKTPGLHQDIAISSISITDLWEPKEEGLVQLETTRQVSMISVTLSTKELNKNSPGYQAPLLNEKSKQLNYQPRQGRGMYNAGYDDSYGRSRGRGRGRRGQGQGWGRGGYERYQDNGGYSNYGRGGGRGRGREYHDGEYQEGGYQGGRYQGGRSQEGRYQGGSYQGGRNQGGGYQGGRNQRGGYQGGRNQGGGYQGGRNQGGGYQGGRYQEDGYQGGRYQEDGYQGGRYQGDGYQGGSYQADGYQGGRGGGRGYGRGPRARGRSGGRPRGGANEA